MHILGQKRFKRLLFKNVCKILEYIINTPKSSKEKVTKIKQELMKQKIKIEKNQQSLIQLFKNINN